MSNIAAADPSRSTTNVGARNLEHSACDSKKCLRITSYVVALILYTVGTLVIARLGSLNSISQSFGAVMVGGALLVLIICLSACQQSAQKEEVDENGEGQRAKVLQNPNVRKERGNYNNAEVRRFIRGIRRKSEKNIKGVDARIAKLAQSATAQQMGAATPAEREIQKMEETQPSQDQILTD